MAVSASVCRQNFPVATDKVAARDQTIELREVKPFAYPKAWKLGTTPICAGAYGRVFRTGKVTMAVRRLNERQYMCSDGLRRALPSIQRGGCLKCRQWPGSWNGKVSDQLCRRRCRVESRWTHRRIQGCKRRQSA